MTLAEQIGRNVAEARRQAGLSQVALSECVPMRQQEISRLERGRHCPRVETLLGFARALEVPVAELLAGVE
jgi:ribosome-binding protein aMBF1 (putative translation factor)